MAMLASVFERLDMLLRLVFEFPYFDVYFFGRPVNVLSGIGCGFLRAMSGQFVAQGTQKCKRPVQTLKLYEFEACPFCRKVRETLCVLDLDVEVYPCPKPALTGHYGSADSNLSRFRGDVANPDGKTRFPVLLDNGQVIRNSEDIIAHLWKEYGGEAAPPVNYRIGRMLDRVMPVFMLPSLLRLRPSHGMVRHPSRKPDQPLVLWGYEPSTFVKIVREALCCLELPYLAINVPHGSSDKRNTFREKYGSKMSQGALRRGAGVIQVPMLIDPNNPALKDEPMFESAAIVKYLYETYGLSDGAKKDK
jgi:glutathione S-transferase